MICALKSLLRGTGLADRTQVVAEFAEPQSLGVTASEGRIPPVLMAS